MKIIIIALIGYLIYDYIRDRKIEKNLQRLKQNVRKSVTTMDKKLTDNEIVKALPFIAKYCKDEYNGISVDEVLLGAFDLINRLQAENERLQKHIQEGIDLAKQIPEMVSLVQAEAYKEFAEEIFELFPKDKPNTVISRVTVKHILKELVGE